MIASSLSRRLLRRMVWDRRHCWRLSSAPATWGKFSRPVMRRWRYWRTPSRRHLVCGFSLNCSRRYRELTSIPLVSLAFAVRREISPRDVTAYVVVQLVGALCGVWLAHLMFDVSVFQIGEKVRSGVGQFTSEIVATAGLMVTIFVGRRSRPSLVAPMVAAYIGCAYWFTASTSFANPAVTTSKRVHDHLRGHKYHGHSRVRSCTANRCDGGLLVRRSPDWANIQP